MVGDSDLSLKSPTQINVVFYKLGTMKERKFNESQINQLIYAF